MERYRYRASLIREQPAARSSIFNSACSGFFNWVKTTYILNLILEYLDLFFKSFACALSVQLVALLVALQ